MLGRLSRGVEDGRKQGLERRHGSIAKKALVAAQRAELLLPRLSPACSRRRLDVVVQFVERRPAATRSNQSGRCERELIVIGAQQFQGGRLDLGDERLAEGLADPAKHAR